MQAGISLILSISRRPLGDFGICGADQRDWYLLQMEISRQLGDGTSYMDGTQHVFFVMTGIVLMSIVQYVDYTRIAAYAKWIGAGILLVGGYAVLFGSMANGSLYYITIGSYHISSPFLGFIYVPLYGAILYQYYGQGYRGLLKSLIWMLLPVVILGRANSISMTFSFAICLSVVLTLAVAKGWFKVSKWKVLDRFVVCCTAASHTGAFPALQITNTCALPDYAAEDFLRQEEAKPVT